MQLTKILARPCTIRDAEMIFNWRNLPNIIDLSTKKTMVTWEEHYSWLSKCLSTPDNSRVYILCYDKDDIGICRFDSTSASDAEISVYLIPEYWGKGLGVPAIINACKQVFCDWPHITFIYANVLLSNTRGYKAFIDSNFLPSQSGVLDGHNQLKLERTVR